MRSCLVPRSRVDIDFERPDDVKFLLRAPEHLNLPRILAGIADRPQIVLLLAGAVLIDVDLVVLRFVRETARHARKEFVRGKVARLGLQLIADFHIDLRLLGLKHLYQLVGEHRALVRRLVKTRIDEKKCAVTALIRFELGAVQFDIAILLLHRCLNTCGQLTIILVIRILIINMNARGRIEVHLVVLAERDGRPAVLQDF